jgi:hypothetical protein
MIVQFGCFQFSAVQISGLKDENKIERLRSATPDSALSNTACRIESTKSLISGTKSIRRRSRSNLVAYRIWRLRCIDDGSDESKSFSDVKYDEDINDCASDALFTDASLVVGVVKFEFFEMMVWNCAYVTCETPRSNPSTGNRHDGKATGTRSRVTWIKTRANWPDNDDAVTKD